MKKNKIVIMVLFTVVFSILSPRLSRAQEEVVIGVLAKRGAKVCMQKWAATAEYLTKKIPGKTFTIAPVSFNGVYHVIKNNEVHFFLGNSSMGVTAQVRYNAVPVLTMINAAGEKGVSLFGGVIFTAKDNEAVNTLADLNGKNIMAVKETSFGGWQTAYKEFVDNGIDPLTDFKIVEWGGSHDKVVAAVKFRAVDAGIVRTDTLERMEAEGKIDLRDYKIVNKKENPDFPFVCSTALYPEWPLMKVAGTSDAIAKEVVDALLEMRFYDVAAQKAKIIGWKEALDYKAVEEVQKLLKVGAYLLENGELVHGN